MKNITNLSMAMILLIAGFSCSKDSTPVDDNSSKIAGTYVGAYGFDNDDPSVYYALNIKSNGTIEELNKIGDSKGSGTWTLTGKTFKAKYTWTILGQDTYSLLGTYDEATHTISGTWGFDDDVSEGKFEVFK